MKNGILIVARTGSKRLKDKHFLKVGETPILSFLIERIKSEFKLEIEKKLIEIVIVTSENQENKKFELFKELNNISVFYGSDHNIPLRQLQCAQEYNFQNIISIDGDDIFISKNAMRNIYQNLSDQKNAIITKGLPLGMNVMGYSTDYLKNSLDNVKDKTIIETGWGRIFENFNEETITNFDENEIGMIRATLDYQEDFDFFANVIQDFHEDIVFSNDMDLIHFIIKNKSYLINSFLNESYWENFNKEVTTEQNEL
jgi:spore coat polysaccharide biosynthesis protein SpsF